MRYLYRLRSPDFLYSQFIQIKQCNPHEKVQCFRIIVSDFLLESISRQEDLSASRKTNHAFISRIWKESLRNFQITRDSIGIRTFMLYTIDKLIHRSSELYRRSATRSFPNEQLSFFLFLTLLTDVKSAGFIPDAL